MKYLIMRCEELGDQWECDADRTPVCITDNFDKFNQYGYEIYKICDNETFELIKQYYESSEEGFAVYKWYNDDDVEDKEPNVIMEKIKGVGRSYFTKSKAKKIKSKYGFKDTVNEIYTDIRSCGSHSEEIDNEWVVIGEYIKGMNFSKGY